MDKMREQINGNNREILEQISSVIDVENSEIEIDETELYNRIKETFASYNIEYPDDGMLATMAKYKKSQSVCNCPNCGAPIHGNKCEYCGTEP